MIAIATSYSRENSERLFNRINWQQYARTAFEKAAKENKPVFLVISAPAWCHWCHVYESEDYLFNNDVCGYINKYFVPVFVDSDKRPDVLKKLEGGWPSTIMLAPDGEKLVGFSGPCSPRELLEYCEFVVNAVKNRSFSNFKKPFVERVSCSVPTKEELNGVEKNFLSYIFNISDKTFGGFHTPSGQKFPTGLIYDFLLDKYEETKDGQYLKIVDFAFGNQFTDIKEIKTKYRLFDPVDGGFHRYSTQQDWSVPHYEKLLCDQATLIRAYAHLFNITHDQKVKNVVDASLKFVFTKLSSSEGSFYNSQDAGEEERYYGESVRSELAEPFIYKLCRIDANCLMIRTLLYVYDVEKNAECKARAEKGLLFIKQKMLAGNGAFFYFDEGQSFLAGFSLANAHALLTFIDAYEILNNDEYFVIAKNLADFCLQNLSDGAGFFDRKSSEGELYPPDEENDFEKSYAENALFAYCFARLYRLTKDQKYRDVVMKTFSILLELSPQNLDDVTYFLKAVKLLQVIIH